MQNEEIVNSVGKGLGLGKNVQYALHTDEFHVYRVTGMDQIEDIIDSGCVRPKGYGRRQQRVGNKIYWATGGPSLYYIDKRPVIESTIENVCDGQIGTISIDDLSAIWIFDENENKYVDNLDYIKSLYEDNKNSKKI